MAIVNSPVYRHGNFGQSTLSADISDSVIALNVVDGSSFPTSTTTRFTIVISDGVQAPEVIDVVTHPSGSTRLSNLLRGRESTSAKSWAAGSTVTHVITAGVLDKVIGDINTLDEATELIPGGFDTSAGITISGGEISYRGGFLIVDTQAAAATDDLDTLVAASGGNPRAPRDGDICTIKILNESRVVTVRHLQNGGVDDFDLEDGTNYELNALEQSITFHRQGDNWKQLFKSGKEKWHVVGDPGEPAFENSWTSLGLAFLKDSDNVVHFRAGTINTTTPGINSTIFTLPPGYRQESGSIISYPIYKLSTTQGVDILLLLDTSGIVRYAGILGPGDATVSLRLSSVQFVAEA